MAAETDLTHLGEAAGDAVRPQRIQRRRSGLDQEWMNGSDALAFVDGLSC